VDNLCRLARAAREAATDAAAIRKGDRLKVVFVNRFFWPDISATSQLLTELAEFIATHGHEVHVIASRSRYDGGAPLAARDSFHGVQIHRVRTSRFGRRSIGRVFDYLSFYAAATVAAFCIVRRGDVLVAKTDPPMLSVPLAMVCGARRAHLVNWLQDVFPEIAERLETRLPASTLLRAVRNWSLRRASINVCISDGMKQLIVAAAGPRTRTAVIHNWSDGKAIRPLPPRDNSLRAAWGLEERVVFGYSGNMGRAHELGTILEVATHLSAREDIAFLFIGDGKQREWLEREARDRGLDNVLFQPYQPYERLPLSLTVPDVHFVSLKPQLEGLIFPSKLYGALSAGRPIIFLGDPDGEVARLIERPPARGLAVSNSDVAGLERCVVLLADDAHTRAVMGRSGRELFEARFERQLALEAWRSVIESSLPL
jgi:glycosyltransferase involved in cell wall biosynthesis